MDPLEATVHGQKLNFKPVTVSSTLDSKKHKTIQILGKENRDSFAGMGRGSFVFGGDSSKIPEKALIVAVTNVEHKGRPPDDDLAIQGSSGMVDF